MTENTDLTNLLEKTSLEIELSTESIKKLVENILRDFGEYSEKELLFNLKQNAKVIITNNNSSELRAEFFYFNSFRAGNFSIIPSGVCELFEHDWTKSVEFNGKKEGKEISLLYTAKTNMLKIKID